MRILEASYGPSHPTVAFPLTNLGALWSDLGEPAKAREVLERALRDLRIRFPDGHRLTSMVTSALQRVDPDLIILSHGRTLRPHTRQPPDNTTS